MGDMLELKSKKFKRATKLILFFLMYLYLPITRNAIEILICSSLWKESFNCYEGVHWVYIIASILTLAFITISVPQFLYSLTKNNKPPLRNYSPYGEPLT